LDAVIAAAPHEAARSAHSPEALAWSKRYGIDLDEFVPFQPPAVGTYTMSVAEAARELGLSLEQVRRHLRAGHLRGIAMGGRAGWRVSRADLARFHETREALSAGRASSAEGHE
jgi:excisionase family DNA binding protein